MQPAHRSASRANIVALISSALLFGCGGSVVLHGGDDSAPPDTTTTSNPPPDDPPPGVDTVCPSAAWPDESLFVAAVHHERATSLVRADGQLLDVPLTWSNVPEGSQPYRTVAAHGPDLAVSFSWVDAANQTIEAGSELLSLEGSSGALRWRHIVQGYQAQLTYLHDDGNFTISRYFYDAQVPPDHALVRQDGIHPLEGFTPRGRATDGWLPAARIADGALGWLHLESDQFGSDQFVTIPLAGDVAGAIAHRTGFVSIFRGNSTTGLIIDLAPNSESTTIALDQIDADPSNLSLSRYIDPWLLVVDAQSQRWWRVDLDAQTVDAVDMPPPAGHTTFSDMCGFPGPLLDSQGRILMPMKTPSSASMHAYDFGDSSWAQLGQSVTALVQIEVQERDGSYVVSSDDGDESFCSPVAWQPPDDDAVLTGSSAQLLRPSAGIARPLPVFGRWLRLNQGGTCVAYHDNETQQATIVDVITGESVVVADDAAIAWLE